MTGYALGLDGDTGRDGQPVWYGGGKLAADLTLPKLRARWDPARAGAGPRPGSAERNATWDYAARTAAEASAAIAGPARMQMMTARSMIVSGSAPMPASTTMLNVGQYSRCRAMASHRI